MPTRCLAWSDSVSLHLPSSAAKSRAISYCLKIARLSGIKQPHAHQATAAAASAVLAATLASRDAMPCAAFEGVASTKPCHMLLSVTEQLSQRGSRVSNISRKAGSSICSCRS